MGQIHYRTEGEGPVLLLLHQSSTSSRLFSTVIPVLSDWYRVVAPDIPGFGNPDPPPEDVSFPDLAACLVDFLDELGSQTRHVLGLHTGNKIAAAMAARVPTSVDRVILCGEPHSIVPDEERRDAIIRARNRNKFRQDASIADDSHGLKEWGRLHTQITDLWWDFETLTEEGFSEETADFLADRVVDKLQSRNSFDTIYAANFAYDFVADLARIEAPTLVLELGKPEDIDEYGLQGNRVADIVPNGTWVLLDDATKYAFHRSPRMIADEVIEFLETSEDSR
jgi:pimeloyl-ACP methyl ester carboxylesterase